MRKDAGGDVVVLNIEFDDEPKECLYKIWNGKV